jgi:protein-serine/threonine kinase
MVNAVHTTMASSNSRSNSPTFSLSGTRSRSTSASQFGSKLKGLFKFGNNSVQSSKSSHSSSTEHLPRLPTPPSSSERNGGTSGSTVSINPYFLHQGLPSHAQINGTSTGRSSADGMDSLNGSINVTELEEAISKADKEPKQSASPPLSPTSALKRQLRRVASAPNAHGLLAGLKQNNSTNASTQSIDSRKTPPLPGPRPPTADGIPQNGLTGDAKQNGYLLPVPAIRDLDRPGRLQKTGAFRRTYSSNSIKVRNVEVGPSSFEKIKLLGKGDVGKVYLVREKKSHRLYAMKGISICETLMQS